MHDEQHSGHRMKEGGKVRSPMRLNEDNVRKTATRRGLFEEVFLAVFRFVHASIAAEFESIAARPYC